MMNAAYIDHMGSDLMVVNAARVSFDKESDWADSGEDFDWNPQLTDADTRLISFLARNGHWTPFAHPQITLHMKAPLPVRTQCFKHKVGFTENEISRRYVSGEPEVFTPTVWRKAATDKKQGSGEPVDTLTHYQHDYTYRSAVRHALLAYNQAIERGICPEQARMVLPQGMMTEWYWTGSLAAWARFANLRLAKDAQKETAELAEMANNIIQPLFPVSWDALTSPVEDTVALEMVSALMTARDTFRSYAKLHADKQTPEGLAKSRKNQSLADMMAHAIEKVS